MKRLFNYLVWLMVTILFVYIGLRIRVFLGSESEIAFENDQIIIFNVVFPILVGILLRLPKYLEEKKGKKKWKFDWIKLIVLAFPSLYITILPYMVNTKYGERLVFAKQVFLLGDSTQILTTIGGLVFGYVVTDSIKF